jgi:hypothetical protein
MNENTPGKFLAPGKSCVESTFWQGFPPCPPEHLPLQTECRGTKKKRIIGKSATFNSPNNLQLNVCVGHPELHPKLSTSTFYLTLGGTLPASVLVLPVMEPTMMHLCARTCVDCVRCMCVS